MKIAETKNLKWKQEMLETLSRSGSICGNRDCRYLMLKALCQYWGREKDDLTRIGREKEQMDRTEGTPLKKQSWSCYGDKSLR